MLAANATHLHKYPLTAHYRYGRIITVTSNTIALMKEIVLIFRKPFPGQCSIEYLFYNISSSLNKQNLPINNVELSHYSKGLLNRVLNTSALLSHKKKIIHITGDVHYTILGAWFSKRVLTIHDFGFMHNKGWLARNVYWLFWIYFPVTFSQKVTVVSNHTKSELLKYIKVNPKKVSVIGNFIDEIYKPIATLQQGKPPRLLQIGTAFNKNLERLIEAIKDLDCTLVIIGRLSQHIINLLQANHIRYENKYDLAIEELYAEYQKSNLLCYVSTLEGFGMPILEAQATGIPVITSNCSSMPEVAGDGALLVNPLDVNAIRNGVKTLISNTELQKELRQKGFENARRYSKKNIAEAYANLYQQL
ncbi:glycosyltransferase family 4 protein [Mucilaginibacter lacusdianchii]|uniref:glycosyltransferase family 4 protein n=1 Tax=Mucilaginibacter lacusdianchii TaxID=2684211 RepID=UPI00131AD9F1|nr:glycosyltransferase family 1 protein [Mucilaginibacter sp. JXJ CY 39]